MALRRSEPAAYFRLQDGSGRLLAERRRWLAQEPARYAALQPEGEAALAEWIRRCRGWGLAGRDGDGATVRLRQLGAAIEPDFLLLAPGEDGVGSAAACSVFPPAGRWRRNWGTRSILCTGWCRG